MFWVITVCCIYVYTYYVALYDAIHIIMFLDIVLGILCYMSKLEKLMVWALGQAEEPCCAEPMHLRCN